MADNTITPKPVALRLPLDIYLLVFDVLSEETKPDWPSLKACSLVCSSFRHACQRILFRVVDLDFDPDEGEGEQDKTASFLDIVSANPRIGRAVRRLEIALPEPPKTPPFILPILSHLALVSEVDIFFPDGSPPSQWSLIPSDLRIALETLMVSPTISVLHLGYATLPLHQLVLALGKNVHSLTLHEVFNDPDLQPLVPMPQSQYPAAPRAFALRARTVDALLDVRRTDGQAWIDWDEITALTLDIGPTFFDLTSSEDLPEGSANVRSAENSTQTPLIMQVARNVADLYINIADQSQNLGPSFFSGLDPHTFTILEALKFDIEVATLQTNEDGDGILTMGVFDTLTGFPQTNVLKSIEVYIDIQYDEDQPYVWPSHEEWVTMASVIQPDCFRKLEKLEVHLDLRPIVDQTVQGKTECFAQHLLYIFQTAAHSMNELFPGLDRTFYLFSENLSLII